MSQYRNVTMLEDLPDVGELQTEIGVGDHTPSYQTSLTPDQYKKFIRGKQEMYQEAGMGTVRPETREQYQLPPPEPERIQPQPKYANIQHNCLDIAGHIQECPICSRFYSNDRTIYIIIITILSLICLLLIKKILNV